MNPVQYPARLGIGLVIALAWPALSSAQPPPEAFKLSRFDMAALTGWVRINTRDLPGEIYSTWDATALGSLLFGVYWTEHVKSEVEVGLSGERSVFSAERLEVGRNLSRYLYRENYLESRSFSVTPTYQFLHNAWIHPFVGVGVDVEWEHRRTESRIQTFSGSGAVDEELPETSDRTVGARLALSTGFKGYVARKAFVRSDVRVAFASGVRDVKWRIGGGIDF
jgi:hypothetical protein